MHVVATAGHVDHGKSTLVRALTGMEPDRFAEERRRGMTIDLGYAWTTLPSGERLGFVDVPGHQRFVANMLAGVGPAPAVLFVVAADEGWRRQSAEHLAALDALGVRHGLLAVTRSDLLDPSLATAEALEHLAASSLGEVEAVAVSGATGEGLDALRTALDRLVGRLPAPVPDVRVRLWVDRAFSVRGSGTVVTGTLGAGTLRVGDELSVSPGGARVRVRGLESLKERHESVGAVARVAVNLRGAGLDDVRRGASLLTPDSWIEAAELDVRLTADARDLPRELVLHVGAAGVPVHVRPLGTDTARLALRTPLPLQTGDRALLRDPGEQRVAAGVLVLDAAPPSLRRRGAATARSAVLAGMSGTPDATVEVARRGAASRTELAALGILAALAPAPPGTVAIGQWLVDGARWRDWQSALAAAVDRHAAEHPLEPGLPLDAARHALAVPDRRVLEALVAATEGVVEEAGRVRRPEAGLVLAPDIRAALDRLRERLAAVPFAAPEQPDLDALGLTVPILAALARAGVLLRVEPGVYLLPDAEDEAVRRLAALPQPFTASEARRALDTTRRVAIPLLEHLDRRGRTRRVDPTRREVRTPPPLPPAIKGSAGRPTIN